MEFHGNGVPKATRDDSTAEQNEGLAARGNDQKLLEGASCCAFLPDGEASLEPVNERKKTEEALQAADDRDRLVAAALTDLILEWDINTDEVSWSSRLDAELGYEPRLRSRAWWAERVHPEDRASLRSEIVRCIKDGSRLRWEARFRKCDGTYVNLQQRGFFQRDLEGRAVRLICAMQNVTERNFATDDLRRREAQLANIFSQALVGIMECSPDGKANIVNARFCEILGRTAEELQATTIFDFTHPDDLIWNVPLLREKSKDGTPFQVEKRYLRPDGSVVWCLVSISFVLGPTGEVESSIAVAEDISEKRKAEADLKSSERLHRSILDASADCIKIIDIDGKLELMNAPGLCAMEIDSFDTVRGVCWVDLWPAEGQPKALAAVADALAGKMARFSAFCPTARGTPKWWDVVVSPMPDDHGRVTKLLAISRDITAQRKIAAEVKWASEHDALTGLANRRAFAVRLQASIIRAMQSGGKVGLLLLDLDHFKHVNDALGHAAGDYLLSEFGKRLQQCVRGGDFVARLGGDEFAVILEGGEGGLDLPGAGQSILQRLHEPVKFEGRIMSTGASIGGALFPSDAQTANDLVNSADIALYALKETGRGGTRMFHQHMREQAQLVSSQLSLARSAINGKSVEPHYQQKVDLRTGRIAGFEALLRWRHMTRGIQSPDTVFEAFKDYELAAKIGNLMQRRVFSDMRDWLSRGVPIGFVAINAAPVEFLRDDFAERFLARLEEHEIPPHLVEVEVTEHAFIERGSAFVGRALRTLSAAGTRIALDDFGTGSSSLSHLRDYPVDVVKIDRSFIDKVTTDSEVCAIVCAVIDLAKSLKIEVVAEGVETEEQRRLLIREGCALGQGYLFGRAIQAAEVPSLLDISPSGSISAAG